MKALVTGGAGFIGSHLVERLAGLGHAAVVYDNFSSGKRENLQAVERTAEIVDGDVRDAPMLDYYARGCDVIFHQAAIVSVPYSVAHPQESHDVNLQGTLNVLTAARRQGVKRVVFACSAAVYGDDPEVPKRESMRPEPASPYAVEKLASEHYLGVFSRLFGVATVSLRYFNVFGERQDPSSPYSGVVSVFVQRARGGAPVTIFGDGSQSRDFVYVGDVVDANLLAATSASASGGVYNVGRGEQTTLLELLATLERIVGRPIPRTFAPARAGDVRDSLADISRIRQELGYAPSVPLEEGLRALVRAGP